LRLGPVERPGPLDLLHPQIGIVLAEFGERGASLGGLGAVGAIAGVRVIRLVEAKRARTRRFI